MLYCYHHHSQGCRPLLDIHLYVHVHGEWPSTQNTQFTPVIPLEDMREIDDMVLEMHLLLRILWGRATFCCLDLLWFGSSDWDLMRISGDGVSFDAPDADVWKSRFQPGRVLAQQFGHTSCAWDCCLSLNNVRQPWRMALCTWDDNHSHINTSSQLLHHCISYECLCPLTTSCSSTDFNVLTSPTTVRNRSWSCE